MGNRTRSRREPTRSKNSLPVTSSNFTIDNALEVTFAFLFPFQSILSIYYNELDKFSFHTTSPGHQECTSYHQSCPLQLKINTGLPRLTSPALLSWTNPSHHVLTISNNTCHETVQRLTRIVVCLQCL